MGNPTKNTERMRTFTENYWFSTVSILIYLYYTRRVTTVETEHFHRILAIILLDVM